MTPKFRNIIIFVTIAAALILVYVFFIKSTPEQPNLASTTNTQLPNINEVPLNTDLKNEETSVVAKDFLALLLNVKNIKLNDAVFSEPAFESLHDSSIILVPDGTEGRPNPFAQFGNDGVVPAEQALPIQPATQTPSNSSNSQTQPNSGKSPQNTPPAKP